MGIMLGLGVALLGFPLSARTAETNHIISEMPTKSKLHLYAYLLGQSNMAGRGKVGAEDKKTHPRVLVFTLSNTWELAVEPVTKDRKTGLGVGPRPRVWQNNG